MPSVTAPLPRVTIQFCTQCKWLLRAAYFAQELLSTFGTALGEVALQPSTGGTFIVDIYYSPSDAASAGTGEDEMLVQRHVLWDRKVEGGFPETKELKKRVRDIIDPGRDLGHVDGKKKTTGMSEAPASDDVPSEQTLVEGPETAVRPKAIRQLKSHDGERKFTPMDVDSSEAKEGRKAEVKRNPDGRICEDCN